MRRLPAISLGTAAWIGLASCGNPNEPLRDGGAMYYCRLTSQVGPEDPFHPPAGNTGALVPPSDHHTSLRIGIPPEPAARSPIGYKCDRSD